MSLLKAFLIFLNLIIQIFCVYRQEAYKFFDKFTLVDLLSTYHQQLEKRSCSLSDGPECFQLSNSRDLRSNEYLKSIIEKLKKKNSEISTETLYKWLKKELSIFKDKHKDALSEVFKFKPKIMMNLLMNFESYDQTTKDHDVYMPEEKIIHFNVGHLKLNFRGKLRLTMDRENKDRKIDIKSAIEMPVNTYGVIEDEDLYIKFDKPVYVKSLYLRLHKSEVNEFKDEKMFITGFKNNKEVVGSKISSHSYRWYIVPFKHVPIDMLKIPKGYDIDNINIQHDSELVETGSDLDEGDQHLASLLQTVIDEMLDKPNKKIEADEDDF